MKFYFGAQEIFLKNLFDNFSLILEIVSKSQVNYVFKIYYECIFLFVYVFNIFTKY